MLQQQLAREHVVADVRLHHLRPGPPAQHHRPADVIEVNADGDANP
jgi:hypothetical protein